MTDSVSMTDPEIDALALEVEALVDALVPQPGGPEGDYRFSTVMCALELVIIRKLLANTPNYAAVLIGAQLAAKHLIGMAAVMAHARDQPKAS